MTLDKTTYMRIVKTALKAMVDMSKEDEDYKQVLGLDMIHYYAGQIVPDGVITEKEFKELCFESGIALE